MAQARLKSKTLIDFATFFFFFIMCGRVLSNNNDGISDEEAAYLFKLREALSPLGSYWLDNTSMCSWTGVDCSFSGSTNSRYVEKITLVSKGLTGKVPLGLNDSLSGLTYLILTNNSLSGPLPSLAKPSLQHLDLSLNNFTSIPDGFFQYLYNLEYLDLSNNTNLPPWTFPTDLKSSSRLNALYLSATNLNGSLPDAFHSFLILEELDLSRNSLTGILPKSIAQLPNLQALNLSYQKDNKLSGTTQVLSSMPQLVVVDLEGNSLEGSIPDLSNCIHLRYLLLANNRLTGVVPLYLVNHQELFMVSLENNWLQGPLPLFNKTRTPKVNLVGNGFCLDRSGPCDHRVTTLLQVAQAFGYPFLLAQSWRGNNPCQGWNFITCDDKDNIRAVNLTNMNLTGTISPSFEDLTDLYGLYLGGNKLNGSIPESLTTLQQLKILDVSNNNLSGNIPTFSTKINFITAGNAFLRQPHNQANRTDSPSKSSLSPPSIIGMSIGGVGVIVIFVAIVYQYKRRFIFVQKIVLKKETSSEQKVEELLRSYGTSTPMRYTYAEVRQMTNSFHEKLGQGGYGIVYRASLNDGRQVAVKVLKETKGSVEEFVNEVVTISKTSHVNIVSLLGFSYESNKRCLIYEFMLNGSLDKFIFKNKSSHLISNLDRSRLYQIAISVARGLDYLHRGCNTRILYLDIKPQNILLDENFCPKIADFGLAKICKKDESIVSILGTRGTPGYIAPEMFSRMYGGVSHKSNVYSYGMLILEMIGGRRNYDTGESHSGELCFPDWIYKDLEEGNIQSSLAYGDEENGMIMKITLVSLWCIQINPSNRPSMNKVVEMLEGPLQSLPYPPKPIVSSPRRSSLQFSDAYYSSVYEKDSTIEEVNGLIK